MEFTVDELEQIRYALVVVRISGVHMESKVGELEHIRYALEYLHDADLSNFGDDNIRALESAMTKLGINYVSQLEEK